MISIRSAKFCNLKFLLIYLVILGHMVEPRIESSIGIRNLYGLIYMFHMPLFAFLTGLFAKSSGSCKKQGIRLLKLYFVLQILIVTVTWGQQRLFTPWWHLWYLLSSGWWMISGWIWFRYGKEKWEIPVLICAVILGCIVGYVPWVNRVFSLSRTIVFFPFYFAGLLCEPDRIDGKYRGLSIIMLGIALMLFILIRNRIPASFLYQAESYGEIRQGWIYRAVTYGIGVGISFFLLVFAPKKRRWYTKYGLDTLIPYLFHGPIVLLLRRLPMPWYILPVLSFFLIILLYRGSCLYYRLYGIREKSVKE